MAKKAVVETESQEKVETKVEAKAVKQQKKQKKDNTTAAAPKRSRIKETFGELKKVTWPSFGKTMKQTGMVLSVVLIFGVLILGIDVVVGLIIKLLSPVR